MPLKLISVTLLLSVAYIWWPLYAAAQISGVLTIDSGYYHNCALNSSGGIKCWGYNAYGQLGNGTNVDSVISVNVYGMSTGVASIALGGWHSCALTTYGAVKCWGENWSGQLGDGTNANRTTPVDVTGLSSGVKSIRVGDNHSCALTTSGGVTCWGMHGYGPLGVEVDRSIGLAMRGLVNYVNGYHVRE